MKKEFSTLALSSDKLVDLKRMVRNFKRLKRRSKKTTYPDDFYDKIRALQTEGILISQIHRAIGVPASTLYSAFQRSRPVRPRGQIKKAFRELVIQPIPEIKESTGGGPKVYLEVGPNLRINVVLESLGVVVAQLKGQGLC